MRTVDDYLNKQLLRTDANGSSVIANTPWLHNKVFPAAVIRGNHVDPKPWYYYVTLTTGMLGVAKEYQGNFGGGYPNSWLATYEGPFQNVPDSHFNDFREAESAYQKALNKLNDKVRGGLDISVALAESHQTNKMLKSISKAERYIKGFGPRRWANEWLEYRYGWKPLLSDVYDAANELIEVAHLFTAFKGKGHTRVYPDKINTSSGQVDITNLGNYTTGVVTSHTKGYAFSACTLRVLLDLPSNAARAARWSSLNPISIAWELVPYSFVVDWFIDIGSYLRDLESAWLYQTMFRSGSRSDLYRCDITSSCAYQSPGNQFWSTVQTLVCDSKQHRIAFTRDLLDRYPSPNLPRVNTDLSSGRLITAAALLAQFLPVPKPVKAQWMDQMRPFISYGKVKKPKFAFKPQNDWSHELRW